MMGRSLIRERVPSFLEEAARLAVGLFLLWSAWFRVSRSDQFARVIDSWQLFPRSWIPICSTTIVLLMSVAGVSIILRMLPRVGCCCGLLAAVCEVGVQIAILTRGATAL